MQISKPFSPKMASNNRMENTEGIESKMGRPRGFDENAALEAAMRVFWEKSYEGASLSDLTSAMGINKSSMYAAFGDKAALFRRAMERYREGPMRYMREALEKPALRDAVADLLHSTVFFLSQARSASRVLLGPGSARLWDRCGAHPTGDGRMAQGRRRDTAKEVCDGPESGRAAKGHQPRRLRAIHCDRYGWPRRAGRERRITRRDETDRRFSAERD